MHTFSLSASLPPYPVSTKTWRIFSSRSRAFATHRKAARRTSGVSPSTPYLTSVPMPYKTSGLLSISRLPYCESYVAAVNRTSVGGTRAMLSQLQEGLHSFYCGEEIRSNQKIDILGGPDSRADVKCFSCKSLSRDCSNCVTSCNLAMDGQHCSHSSDGPVGF